jgi:two-component system CheB/CheR fusion protein
VDTARADSSSSGLELSCTLPEDPVIVRADAARLAQIVWNLLSNAVKFTPEGGSVEVEVVQDNPFARLSVKDTGQGIEDYFLPRIFEMFGQAPSRALSGKGGLGIGLALVKQLVERHAGRIEVHSAGLGQGSTFSVWLPLFQYEPPAIGHSTSHDAAGSEQQWRGLKVLIVDDAAEALETLAQLLEIEGASVTIAHDGAEALGLFGRNSFDIVFADIGMPNMDGYEFAARVRELADGKDVPLVAMTGFTRPYDVQRASSAGFDAHLGKPLTMDALTTTMQRVRAAKV